MLIPVLLRAANPDDAEQLKPDEEARAIDNVLRRPNSATRAKVEALWRYVDAQSSGAAVGAFCEAVCRRLEGRRPAIVLGFRLPPRFGQKVIAFGSPHFGARPLTVLPQPRQFLD